jgi:ABC-type glycerol-3-phosphate transport system substrate-binding protein
MTPKELRKELIKLIEKFEEDNPGLEIKYIWFERDEFTGRVVPQIELEIEK